MLFKPGGEHLGSRYKEGKTLQRFSSGHMNTQDPANEAREGTASWDGRKSRRGSLRNEVNKASFDH